MMKNVLFACLLYMLIPVILPAQSYDNRSGYYGDNFSLEGALDLFKRSYSLEDFERRLNSQDAWINNLDLDNDGRTDYIRVEHRRYDRNFHAVVLQIPFSRYDVQDVAVIELEQVGNRSVDAQIVGDEDVFGNEIFIEPYGDSQREIYRWPVVQSILDNQYQVYASPYRYAYYPSWWSPWRPVSWSIFRPRIVVYAPHYRIIRTPRIVHVHNYYRPQRAYCHPVVVYSNQVRVKHGQKPIDRPAYNNRDRNNGSYYGSRRNEQTPNGGTYTDGRRRSAEGTGRTETRTRDTNERVYRGQGSNDSNRNQGSQSDRTDRPRNDRERPAGTGSSSQPKYRNEQGRSADAPQTRPENRPRESRSYGNESRPSQSKSSSSPDYKTREKSASKAPATKPARNKDSKPSSAGKSPRSSGRPGQ